MKNTQIFLVDSSTKYMKYLHHLVYVPQLAHKCLSRWPLGNKLLNGMQ